MISFVFFVSFRLENPSLYSRFFRTDDNKNDVFVAPDPDSVPDISFVVSPVRKILYILW